MNRIPKIRVPFTQKGDLISDVYNSKGWEDPNSYNYRPHIIFQDNKVFHDILTMSSTDLNYTTGTLYVNFVSKTTGQIFVMTGADLVSVLEKYDMISKEIEADWVFYKHGTRIHITSYEA